MADDVEGRHDPVRVAKGRARSGVRVQAFLVSKHNGSAFCARKEASRRLRRVITVEAAWEPSDQLGPTDSRRCQDSKHLLALRPFAAAGLAPTIRVMLSHRLAAKSRVRR
jgi:hypothetical protein